MKSVNFSPVKIPKTASRRLDTDPKTRKWKFTELVDSKIIFQVVVTDTL